jgi:hypothetical protein
MRTSGDGEIRDPRLFTRGATLADVPPDFRGIGWAEWERLRERSWQQVPLPDWWVPPEQRVWYRKGIATSISNYGWRSAGR